MEWAIVFIAILIPARIVAGEVDKNTLDVTLSYPIPRWRYILERFMVYLTYSLLYPAFVYVLAVVSTNSLGETLDITVLGHSMIGFWLWFFALGALSLLCGTLFLDSNRALSASGILIVTQYVMTRLGGLGDLSFLKNLTLFNYARARGGGGRRCGSPRGCPLRLPEEGAGLLGERARAQPSDTDRGTS